MVAQAEGMTALEAGAWGNENKQQRQHRKLHDVSR